MPTSIQSIDPITKNNWPVHQPRFSMTAGLVALLLATTVISGCGGGLSGTYTGTAVPFNQFKFTSGSKVEISVVGGNVVEATYSVEADTLKVTLNGQTLVYGIDKDGCLTTRSGSPEMGRLCKK